MITKNKLKQLGYALTLTSMLTGCGGNRTTVHEDVQSLNGFDMKLTRTRDLFGEKTTGTIGDCIDSTKKYNLFGEIEHCDMTDPVINFVIRDISTTGRHMPIYRIDKNGNPVVPTITSLTTSAPADSAIYSAMNAAKIQTAINLEQQKAMARWNKQPLTRQYQSQQQ